MDQAVAEEAALEVQVAVVVPNRSSRNWGRDVARIYTFIRLEPFEAPCAAHSKQAEFFPLFLHQRG
jgi:hypothetical protein